MLDIGGGGSAAFDSIGSSMKALASSAASGGFAVNDTGGQALLQAIRNMKDWVDGSRADLQQLGMRFPLGSSHGAQVMSPFMTQVATDNQGFVPMLMKFRESLDQAEQAINDAMRNYQQMDQGSTGNFSSA